MGPEAKTTEQAFKLPSAYEIAMLAATMRATPEAALKLLHESQILKEVIEEMDARRRDMFFACFARDWYEGWGFNEDNLMDFNAAIMAEPRFSIKEAMQMLEISTEKTFFALLRYHLNNRGLHKDETEAEKQAGIEADICRITNRPKGYAIDGGLVERLKKAKTEKRAAIARQNKVNASHKRKRRKPVK